MEPLVRRHHPRNRRKDEDAHDDYHGIVCVAYTYVQPSSTSDERILTHPLGVRRLRLREQEEYDDEGDPRHGNDADR